MTIVIPDLHGRYDILEQVLELYPVEALVFLGDLIDRGPDSAKVVKKVRELVDSGRARLCLGNHEQMMLDGVFQAAQKDDPECDEMMLWLINGGVETMHSYQRDAESVADDCYWLAEHGENWVVTDEGVLCSHAMRPETEAVRVWEYDRENWSEENEQCIFQPPVLQLWGRPGDDELYPLPEPLWASIHGHTPMVKRSQATGKVTFTGVKTLLDTNDKPAYFIDAGSVFGSEVFVVAEIFEDSIRLHELVIAQ